MGGEVKFTPFSPRYGCVERMSFLFCFALAFITEKHFAYFGT
jgi:hypothetical protein